MNRLRMTTTDVRRARERFSARPSDHRRRSERHASNRHPASKVSVVSSRPFEEIVQELTAAFGHPDMNAFHSAVVEATTVALAVARDLDAKVESLLETAAGHVATR